MNTAVMPCFCEVGGEMKAKSAGAKYDLKPAMPQRPLATRGAEFQDKRYGKGMRLHNVRLKDGKPKGHTCTVCGRRKD